jgi:hypothetical protein
MGEAHRDKFMRLGMSQMCHKRTSDQQEHPRLGPIRVRPKSPLRMSGGLCRTVRDNLISESGATADSRDGARAECELKFSKACSARFINGCKGQRNCKSAKNDCKGKNGCKGQGWLEMLQADCSNAGGQWESI